MKRVSLEEVTRFSWKKQSQRFNQASLKKRLTIFLLTAVIIVMIWVLIILLPLYVVSKRIGSEMLHFKTQTTQFNEEAKRIISKADNVDLEWQTKYKNLQKKIDALNKDIALFRNESVFPEKIDVILPDLVNQKTGLKLINFHAAPVERLQGRDEHDRALYIHGFTIEFSGDYFATLDYLKGLEKIKWRLFWDGINYRVSDYPKAIITINLHVISASSTPGGGSSG